MVRHVVVDLWQTARAKTRRGGRIRKIPPFYSSDMIMFGDEGPNERLFDTWSFDTRSSVGARTFKSSGLQVHPEILNPCL